MLPSSQSQSHPPSPSPSPSSSSPSSTQSPSTVPAGTSDLTPSSEQLPLFNHRQRVRVLKRVPKASRHLAAYPPRLPLPRVRHRLPGDFLLKLARILDDVTDQNTDASWARLLKFCHRCFAQPKRGGRRRSLAALVNQQLQEELDPPQSFPHCPSSRPAYDPLKYLASRVSTKLEKGDYGGAVRIACSEDSIADINADTLSALREKHPQLHPESCAPQLTAQPVSFPFVTENSVSRAIRSFPKGSAEVLMVFVPSTSWI